MEDVGDGEVILKSCDDQDDRSEKDDTEHGDSGAARGFSETF
jgi:hypothetical protein